MKLLYNLIVFLFSAGMSNAQTHFINRKSITYTTVKINPCSNTNDSLICFSLKTAAGANETTIELKEIRDTYSSSLKLSQSKHVALNATVPYAIWNLHTTAYVADINNDKKPDIKILIPGTGNGILGHLITKLYLLSTGDKYNIVSFTDYANEKEYDMNGDGGYEIISCDRVEKNQHSYWVYNVFEYSRGKLTNVSKHYHYPLWTKHLHRTNRVVERKFSFSERLRGFRVLPDETVIR